MKFYVLMLASSALVVVVHSIWGEKWALAYVLYNVWQAADYAASVARKANSK